MSEVFDEAAIKHPIEMADINTAEMELQYSSNENQLTDDEVDIVEFCFKGLGSEMHVSDSAINLYKRKSDSRLKAAVIDAESSAVADDGLNSCSSVASAATVARTSPIDDNDWMYIATGVPLLIRDNGQSKARSKQCLKIIVAERGSCFVLLHDVFDHLSNYKGLQSNFHSFCLSTNRSTEIGFEFLLENVAAQFLSKVNEWIATTDSVTLAATTNRKMKKQKPKRKSKPMPLPPKETISQPCCFRHLISVDKTDDYFTLKKHVSSLF